MKRTVRIDDTMGGPYRGILDLEGDVDDVIKVLSKLKDKFKGSFTRIFIDTEYFDMYEEGPVLVLYGEREETAEEEAVRLNKESERLAHSEEAERKAYEELKAKFG